MGGASGTVDQHSISRSDVIIKYTYVGDVTLDGKVNDSDVGLILAFYDAEANECSGGIGRMVGGDVTFDGFVGDGEAAMVCSGE